jgi:hypothetical protein
MANGYSLNLMPLPIKGEEDRTGGLISCPHEGKEKRSEDSPMRSQPPQLRSFRLKNFKAVRDRGVIRFTPLTVFIGNNGSGKSSIIEGLETSQTIVNKA